jgi:hypothetical protein
MNRKKAIKVTLVMSLFFLALGGLLLHLRIHPPAKHYTNIINLISGIVSVFFLPALFLPRRTVALAYIVNGFLAIIGTITMAHFSMAHFQGTVTISGILLNTTLADIAILWGKFAVGKAIFDLEFLRSDTDVIHRGRFFRYPNMGWWWTHLFSLSAIYALGNILWK